MQHKRIIPTSSARRVESLRSDKFSPDTQPNDSGGTNSLLELREGELPLDGIRRALLKPGLTSTPSLSFGLPEQLYHLDTFQSLSKYLSGIDIAVSKSDPPLKLITFTSVVSIQQRHDTTHSPRLIAGIAVDVLKALIAGIASPEIAELVVHQLVSIEPKNLGSSEPNPMRDILLSNAIDAGLTQELVPFLPAVLKAYYGIPTTTGNLSMPENEPH